MKKNLNPEIIPDNPNFHKFMQVYENEEYQTFSLATETLRVLFLLHTRDTKNKKHHEN